MTFSRGAPDIGVVEYRGSAPPVANGDLNLDGRVDTLDLQLLANVILEIITIGVSTDLNEDGATNTIDLQVMVNMILGGI